MVRGTTEMAKKMSFNDNSGIDMSLPLSLNLHSMTPFIKVFFPAYLCRTFSLSASAAWFLNHRGT